ncbi:MAG: hypothetical protein K2X66_06120, partial [Cyanobacteria bacterium]|nr:hypothetical protein [Cyanobacteriota bacterium]
MTHTTLPTPSLSRYPLTQCFNAQLSSSRFSHRNPSVLSPEQLHFQGKKPKKLIAGLFVGAGLGFASLLSGVGTYFYAKSSAYAKEKPTVIEKQFESENKAHTRKQLKGVAFDSLSTSLKRGLYRAVTGDKTSEAYNDKMAYKL